MVVERKRDVGVRVLVLCSPLSVVCRRPVVAPLRVGRCWLVLSAGASLGTLPGVCWLGCHLPGVALALAGVRSPVIPLFSPYLTRLRWGQLWPASALPRWDGGFGLLSRHLPPPCAAVPAFRPRRAGGLLRRSVRRPSRWALYHFRMFYPSLQLWGGLDGGLGSPRARRRLGCGWVLCKALAGLTLSGSLHSHSPVCRPFWALGRVYASRPPKLGGHALAALSALAPRLKEGCLRGFAPKYYVGLAARGGQAGVPYRGQSVALSTFQHLKVVQQRVDSMG